MASKKTKIDDPQENKAAALLPSSLIRTHIDENFEEAGKILASRHVTLDMALAKLAQIKNQNANGSL